MIRLTAIHVYPVKSCRGIAMSHWPLDCFGLARDRGWMVVDAAGRFLTQREAPRLAVIGTMLEAEALALSAPGQPDLVVPIAPPGEPDLIVPLAAPGAGASGADREGNVEVTVWRHRGPAVDEGERAAEWLARHLGARVRLVRLPAGHHRPVNSDWAGSSGAQTAFSDGYPLLLLSEPSRADLNRRLATPLPMNRFRPNLVVDGCAPYAEDLWKRIRVGALDLAVVKPCSRCAITTTEQSTGERDGVEPLRTLATYRKTALGVVFGQNCVHLAPGTLEVGSPVEILESRRGLREHPTDD